MNFTKIGGSFDFSTSEETHKQIQELERIISFEKDNIYFALSQASMKGNILDLGCGPGSTTEIIAKFDACRLVVGIDREPLFIEYASQKNSSYKIEYIVGDCYNIPAEENTFDCCYARYLFQHLKYPLRALSEIKRVVKPHGVIGIHDFDYDLLITNPEIPELKKLKRINAQLKTFQGGDAYVGRKLESYFKRAGISNVSTIFTFTDNRNNKDFMSLFYNPELDNKAFLVNNGLFSEAEYAQLNSSVHNFIKSNDSYFEIGNYFVYGINIK